MDAVRAPSNLAGSRREEIIRRIEYYRGRRETARLKVQSDYYSLGRALGEVVGMPFGIQPKVEMTHGVYHEDEVSSTDRRCKMYFALRRSLADLFAAHGIPAVVTGSPYVRYRRLRGISRQPEAEGTIAYPSHSTEKIDCLLDWDAYAATLEALPENMRPITVCLYWKDYVTVDHAIFERRGIQVTTAGHMNDPRFIDNFYSMMAKARWATGNEMSSASYYAVEMGLPFFLLGDRAKYDNSGADPNRPPAYDMDCVLDCMPGIRRMFSGRCPDGIDRTQAEFVSSLLGIGQHDEDGVVRRALLVETLRFYLRKLFIIRRRRVTARAKRLLRWVRDAIR